MLYRTQQNDRAMQIAQRRHRQRFGNDQKPFISLHDRHCAPGRATRTRRTRISAVLSYSDPALTKDCQLAAGKKADASGQGSSPSRPSMPSLPFGIPHFP